MSDALRARIREDALEHAAAAAWEHDHPSTPWEQAPESVRASMRALVAPTVDAVIEHLDARSLLDLDPEPDTYPAGTPFNGAISSTGETAARYGVRVRHVYHGVPLVAYPGDSWQDVANRYSEAAQALQ